MSKENKKQIAMEQIVSLSKRRGFIYPSSEIYGGFANSYSYGPYGSLLKKNIKDLWWKTFVQEREDIVGIDGPIMINPRAWEASGHTEGFNDALVDCKECQMRYRADHIVAEATGEDHEGDLSALDNALQNIKCPSCKKTNWTESRFVNMMFKTQMNSFDGDVFLRPETAGSIFVDYKNVLDSTRVKIPFGIAQVGKAFRNEIVARNFIFRLREFEQMEIEYFISPKEEWEPLFEDWLVRQEEFAKALGVKKEDLRRYEHPKEKLSHYSKKTIDLEYNFPFGYGEWFGLAHRTDFDLSRHQEFSGKDLSYLEQSTGEKFLPHVLEPTVGVDRSVLAAMCSAYLEESVGEETRTVMKFPAAIAPIKIAVFPLLKNKPDLVAKAKEVFNSLKSTYMCEFDDNGNIGKRYRRQDEIGTPYCITIDFDTLEDGSVTIRDRDTMTQQRIKINDLADFFTKALN